MVWFLEVLGFLVFGVETQNTVQNPLGSRKATDVGDPQDAV